MALPGFLSGFARRRHEQAGFALYTALAVAARDPGLFGAFAVPDTLDGRFDMLALFAFLLMDRLRTDTAPGPALAQAVFDAMFSDLDVVLREMGAGDPSVPRKMKAMWEALHGRALAYQAALAETDDAALIGALQRNVWRGGPVAADFPTRLAVLVRAQAHMLAEQRLTELLAGRVTFLPAAS